MKLLWDIHFGGLVGALGEREGEGRLRKSAAHSVVGNYVVYRSSESPYPPQRDPLRDPNFAQNSITKSTLYVK